MRTLLATLLLLAPLAPATTAQAAAADMCLGLPATVVGAPGEDVVGTDGPDVVVANGAGQVDTLGGNDRVCVTRRGTFSVETGPGDDQVEWITKRYGGSVDLGAGSDTYTGGDQGSYVDAGDRADALAGQPLGTDSISTGAGLDTVITGHTSVLLPNLDTVVLGGGNDNALVRGMVPETLKGQAGQDELTLRSTIRGDWVVDGPTGVISIDAVPMPAAGSFAAWQLSGLRWSSLEFHGGPGNELVAVAGRLGFVRDDGPFTADMGGGRDSLVVRSQDTGPFDTGEGKDFIRIVAKGTTQDDTVFKADLSKDTYRLTGRAAVEAIGIENLTVVEADHSTVIGDDAANLLNAYGCGNKVYGLGGNDRIDGGATKGCFGDDGTLGLSAFGGAGNDVLSGGPSRDHLFGGPGRDQADGWYGRDQCVAEVRERCER